MPLPLSRSGRRVLGLVVALLAAGCSRQEATSTEASEDEPTQITRGFTTTESDSGQVRYVFRARVARVYEDDRTRADDIEVDFYDGGRRVSVLTAREGTLGGGRMTATGNVVVETEEGARLETESLYWDRENQKIRSEDFVRITRRDDPEVLTGVGLTTDPNLEIVDIGNPNLTGPVRSEEP
jgi:LPS export ABC transporter protein LptC